MKTPLMKGRLGIIELDNYECVLNKNDNGYSKNITLSPNFSDIKYHVNEDRLKPVNNATKKDSLRKVWPPLSKIRLSNSLDNQNNLKLISKVLVLILN